jgi:hypothetical protein
MQILRWVMIFIEDSDWRTRQVYWTNC